MWNTVLKRSALLQTSNVSRHMYVRKILPKFGGQLRYTQSFGLNTDALPKKADLGANSVDEPTSEKLFARPLPKKFPTSSEPAHQHKNPNEVVVILQDFADETILGALPTIYSYKDTEGKAIINAYKYKNCMPTTALENQLNISAPRVYCSREDEANQNIQAIIEQTLEVRGRVGVFGPAAVGKSISAMTAYTSQLLHLNEDKIQSLFVRIDQKLYCAEKTDGVVKFRYVPEAGLKWDEQCEFLCAYQMKKENEGFNKGIVLLAEFNEFEISQKEINLVLLGGRIGMVFWSSNRDVDFLIEGHVKGNVGTFLLTNKMSSVEAMVCAQAMYDLEPNECLWAKGDADSSTPGELLLRDAALQQFARRISVVGPFLRYAAGTEKDYLNRVKEMQDSTLLTVAMNNLPLMNVLNAPKHTDLFSTIALRHRVTYPVLYTPYYLAAPEYFAEYQAGAEGSDLSDFPSKAEWQGSMHKYEFASDFAKEQLATVVATDSHVRSLATLGLKSPLFEYVAKMVLCMTDSRLDPKFRIDEWDVCRDLGCGIALFQGLVVTEAERERLLANWKQCNSEKKFSGRVCKLDISQLEEGVLYHSSDPDMIGAEYFSVIKERKVVSITKVSNGRDRPIPISHLARTMTTLGMQPGGKFEDYKLELVCVTDWRDPLLHGVKLNYMSAQADPVSDGGTTFGLGRLQWIAHIAQRKKLELKAQDKKNKSKAVAELAAMVEMAKMPPADMDWVAERLLTWVVRGSVSQSPDYHKIKLPDSITERGAMEASKRFGLSFPSDCSVGDKEKIIVDFIKKASSASM